MGRWGLTLRFPASTARVLFCFIEYKINTKITINIDGMGKYLSLPAPEG